MARADANLEKAAASEDGYAFVGLSCIQEPPQLRKDLCAARGMAATALGLALLSMCLLAFAMGPLLDPGPAQAQSSFDDVLGFDDTGMQGWYRTYLASAVREGEGAGSEPLRALPEGSLVYVAEVRGQEARLLKPVPGWMSVRTSEGVEVLSRDMTYFGSPERTEILQVYRSRRAREANERMQASVAKWTAMQQQMTEALRQLKDGRALSGLGRQPQRLGKEVGSRAPRVGQAWAESAARALKKAVHPQDARRANHFVQELAHEPRVQGLVQDQRVQPAAAAKGRQAAHAAAVDAAGV